MPAMKGQDSIDNLGQLEGSLPSSPLATILYSATAANQQALGSIFPVKRLVPTVQCLCFNLRM